MKDKENPLDKLSVGQSASISKAFSEAEVEAFAKLSLDFNPVHLDDQHAKNSIFGERVVHGALVSSLFSALLGNKLPGKGSIYLSQEVSFKRPVFIGQEVTAKVEITDIRHSRSIVTLKTVCKNDKEEIVITGKAVVMLN